VADGVHVNVRLDEDKLCLLAIVGVRADDGQGVGRCGRRYLRVDRLLDDWAHLPGSDPILSPPFATVHRRTRVTKGAEPPASRH